MHYSRKRLSNYSLFFCSHLSRAIDTARPLCPKPMIREGLEEQDMGVWDGLSFREIMARYPALYAAREDNPSLLPDGAEHVVAADFVEPAAVVLVGVDVELYGDVLFALLNVELPDAVFAEDAEDHALRVLRRHFQYILLRHPRIARAH